MSATAPPTTTAPVDQAIAAKCNEIKALPYAKSIVSEDVIERNFGYKIVRQQVSHGRNSLIFKCESVKHPDAYCLVKPYRFGREKVKHSLKEETCQIMRYVATKCAQLISTYDIYYTSEKIYLMCDWTQKGEVLGCMRNKTVRLTEEILRNWTIDILNAITFLHNNAICHRNIAPSSLLLTNDNHVKIGTLSDAVVYCKPDGTLIKQKWVKFSRTANWNQAPEVAKGRMYDPRRADIWSIGATVYWFIVRTYPIDYRSSSRLTKQLEHRLSMMVKVSTRCQTFVRKLLNFQPSQRPNLETALAMDWITIAEISRDRSPSKSPSATKFPEPAAGAEITGEKIETGEAVGPDEVAEAEATAPTSLDQQANAAAANNSLPPE